MGRDFQIDGESLVTVKGSSASLLSATTELGLADRPIEITSSMKYMDINVDAWGEAPADVQMKLGTLDIRMVLAHFDPVVLEACVSESMAGAADAGSQPRAGTRLGNGAALYSALNRYISVGITAPQNSRPWRFYACYLQAPAFRWPVGTERSLVEINWRCIPYTVDPWGGGLGALLARLWDRGTL